MTELNASALRTLHWYCSKHNKLLEESALAGCFFCKNIFGVSEIKDWIDGGKTALCPKCGIDAVLPGVAVDLTQELLTAMNDYWFQGSNKP